MTYLVRYGLMGHIGRFRGSAESEDCMRRGQMVVVLSSRGVELGEILVSDVEPLLRNSRGETEQAERKESLAELPAPRGHVCRVAGSDDFALAQRAVDLRSDRLSTCRRILSEEGWPWELLDVEPLLDCETTVLHYLGPHDLDIAAIRARFRAVCNFDILLEPIGIDVAFNQLRAAVGQGGSVNSCGFSECGTVGCGAGGCQSSTSRGGCTSCGISRWIADRHG